MSLPLSMEFSKLNIGFSTGSLAHSDFKSAIAMIEESSANINIYKLRYVGKKFFYLFMQWFA